MSPRRERARRAAGAGAGGTGDTEGTGPASRPRPIEGEQILAGIAEVARGELGWQGPLGREMRLVEDLHLDSIRLLTLTVEIENRFQIILDPADESAVETVGDLVELVRSKLG